MKKYILRIASIFMVFVLSLILCVSAFAASAPVYDQKTTWWHWVKDVPFLGDWVAYRLGAVCPNSEDKYHHASTYQSVHEDGYFTCICTYCGQEFIAYESDLQQSYQQQVDSLPAPGYNSAGRLIWQPRFEDVSNFCVYASSRIDISSKITANSSDTGFIYNNSGNNGLTKIYFVFDILSTPISGLYFCQESCSFILRCSNDGQVFTDSKNYPVGSWFHRSVGEVFCSNVSTPFTSRSYSGGVYASFNVFFPVYEIIPDTAIDITPSGQYGINSAHR